MKTIIFFLTAFFITCFSSSLTSAQDVFTTKNQDCQLTDDMHERILKQVELKNSNAIKVLPYCFKLDNALMLKVAIMDPEQFQNAAEILREDAIFVNRLIKINPEILKFASVKLRSDPDFMELAVYLNRDALKYADPKLLDKKLFIEKMIGIDSRNYMFASDRLKESSEFAKAAFADNGALLAFAPAKIQDNKELVKIAIKSNSSALTYSSSALQADKELIKLASQKTSIKSKDDLEKFLYKNYVEKKKKKNLGITIDNKSKFFEKDKIIDRNYITKWQRVFRYDNGEIDRDLSLNAVDVRNYSTSWKEDFKKYPDLIKKIENFFYNRNLDKNTISNLSTTYLWKIKDKPLTLAFNLILVRDSSDDDLGQDLADITSLTAIVQQQKVKGQKDKWNMSVIEAIFDNETKVDVAYANGLKRHVLWDLYKVDKSDQNPKLIFKVEDKFGEYFEIFEEQSGGKYQMIYRVDPLKEPKPEPVLED